MVALGFQLDVVTFNTFFSAYAQAGDTIQVEDMIYEMQQNNLKPNEWTYGIIVNGYCSEGKLDDAFRFVNQMKPNEWACGTCCFRCSCVPHGTSGNAGASALELK
ncbi:hypothetical protein Droror1_Dr00015143 [Drosera rotundifolia]